MAQQTMLIEWCDSWDKRKRVARQRVVKALKIASLAIPLGMLSCFMFLGLTSPDTPWTDKWGIIGRRCMDAIIGTTCFLAFAVTVLVTATLMPTKHGLSEGGLMLNGRFYRWNKIKGYQVDEKANEFGERVIRVLPRTWSLPMYLQFPVPPNTPFDNLLECVSTTLPLSDEEDLIEKITNEQKNPLLILLTVIWGVVVGCLMGLLLFSPITMVVLLVTVFVGPGTVWFAARFPYLLRKPLWLFQASAHMNHISIVIMLYVSLIASVNLLMHGAGRGLHS